ncbi:MAG: hypothetical protein V4477_16770 [Pseudomonadota bacterium]
MHSLPGDPENKRPADSPSDGEESAKRRQCNPERSISILHELYRSRLEVRSLDPSLLLQGEIVFQTDTKLAIAVDDLAEVRQPYTDVSGPTEPSHEAERTVGGLNKPVRPISDCQPILPFRMPAYLGNHPFPLRIIRDRDAWQRAAEQFTLDMASEVPAIAILPCPWLADLRGEEFRARQFLQAGHLAQSHSTMHRRLGSAPIECAGLDP